MTDFHSHLLPGIDDGSDSAETSLSMLKLWREQGISRIAATPHFYADRIDPARFFRSRQSAYDTLTEAMEKNGVSAELVPGAEVHYFSGMGNADVLDDLCLRGTDLLLLEMPFSRPWTESMLWDVAAVRRRGLIPVAAHIERYLPLQPRRMLDRFFELDILFQSNASFFLSRRTVRHALRLLRDGRIHFLGSDAHNVSDRPPDLGPALDTIRRKLGEDALLYLESYDKLTYPKGGVS